MAETLNVKEREKGGKRESRRLRRTGGIPAVLYGHGEANKNLAVVADEMAAVVRHGGRVVDLAGAVQEKALIRALQWDTYGTHVLHVDFTRVSAHERIEVMVSVELKGQAIGVKDGGAIEHLVHEVEIECEALSIPEKLELNIAELAVDGQLTAADLKLPAGVTLITDPETVLVHCVEVREEGEEGAAAAGGAEPEIIGRKAEDEEEAEE
ncbi:MAG: 50S ribosomal protein L25 [Pirellulales bacterium]